jgi:hypothetical protein
MMIFNYDSKKVLKECLGKSLNYTETSMFGNEYRTNGVFTGCNRPSINHKITKGSREFFAEVTIKDNKIVKVT